jgi:ribonuclease BN (tRNA processing enzyme)
MSDDDANPSMIIKYWGVRGSIPSPLTAEQVREKEVDLVRRILASDCDAFKKNMRTDDLTDFDDNKIRDFLASLPLSVSGTYGGDTTCIEVQAKDSPLIMIDAGSGARHLGKALLGRMFSGRHLNPLSTDDATKRDIHLLFTHCHWDHIQGLPFFSPAFIPGERKVNLHFYGKKDATQHIADVLKGQQQYPTFPVEWEDMPCEKKYHMLCRMASHPIELGAAKVTFQELTHPDSVFAYAVEVGGKKFVFATDTEHKDQPDPRLVNLAMGADILYYDSQYTPEEYRGDKGSLTGAMPKFDWGHSTYEWAIRTAIAAGVKMVVLGHHEPLRDDFDMDTLQNSAASFMDQALVRMDRKRGDVNVVLAYQGLEQRL